MEGGGPRALYGEDSLESKYSGPFAIRNAKRASDLELHDERAATRESIR